MEVICGLFVSHYRAADLQIKAGSSTQDAAQHDHAGKYRRSDCVAGWKGIRRKAHQERRVNDLHAGNGAEPLKKGANECGEQL